MTLFDDMLRADARAVFANPAELGEAITYYPEGHEWDAVTLTAVVDRSEVTPTAFGDTDTMVREAIVHVPRKRAPSTHLMSIGTLPSDSLYETVTVESPGVESVCKGKDFVELMLVDGKTPAMARVVRILRSDPGMWELLVQW